MTFFNNEWTKDRRVTKVNVCFIAFVFLVLMAMFVWAGPLGFAIVLSACVAYLMKCVLMLETHTGIHD